MKRAMPRLFGALGAVYLAGLSLSLLPALIERPCAEALPRGEVAVVLGAGPEHEGRLHQPSLLRTEAAVTLFEAGAVERLHFTGGSNSPIPTAQSMARYAEAAGVPAAAISVEADSLSTLQNALFSRPAIAGADGVVLVSSGYHLWRGWASFAWAGIPVDAVCHGTRFDRTQRVRSSVSLLMQEGLKWPANAVRAAAWSASGPLGLRDALPGWLLA